MDLELLNFWINNLGLSISNDSLFVHLKAYSNDPLKAHIIKLSEKKQDILAYFGFDTSIEYEKLTEKNLFVYLSSSSKLKPEFIHYYGFKGSSPKNAQHSRYNKYLLEEFSTPKYDDKYYQKCFVVAKKYKKSAILHFNKKDEYEKYIEKRKLLDKLFEQRERLGKTHFDHFQRFVALHGIMNVVEWDDDKLRSEYAKFIQDNWSCLMAII